MSYFLLSLLLCFHRSLLSLSDAGRVGERLLGNDCSHFSSAPLYSFSSSLPRWTAEDQAHLQLLCSALQDTVAVVWHFSFMWWPKWREKNRSLVCGFYQTFQSYSDFCTKIPLFFIMYLRKWCLFMAFFVIILMLWVFVSVFNLVELSTAFICKVINGFLWVK